MLAVSVKNYSQIYSKETYLTMKKLKQETVIVHLCI